MQSFWASTARPRHPLALFLHIRRSGLLTLMIIGSTALFFALIPVSYGIPPLNNVRETPVYRVLPVILGTLCATCVNPLSSDQELLRGERIRRFRTILPFTFLLLALAVIILSGLVFSRLYPDQDALGAVAPMLTGTTIFAGIGIISACYTSGAWQILPTAIIFLALIGFGFRTFLHPYPWNIFFQVSPNIVTIACVLTVLSFFALRRRY